MAHCGCDPKLEVSPSPLSFSLFFGSGFHVSPCLQFDRLLSKAALSGGALSGPSGSVGCRVLGHGLDLLIDN